MRPFELALSVYGLKEIHGEVDNPVIVGMFEYIGASWVKDDETAWCSAFVNYCAKKCGYEHSGKLNARSWLNTGQLVETPLLGDVVVLWRQSPASWKGHVGFYINHDEHYIYILGGNQSNEVNITPFDKGRLLQYRRLNIEKHG